MLAKEKDIKNEEKKFNAEEVEKEPLVQPELEFVCKMCLALQGKKGKSSDCIKMNARGVLCSSMDIANSLIISLRRENELHDKYLRAFNTKQYFTKEEMHEHYLSLFNDDRNLSFDEFCDYCREAGFIIV